MNIHWFRRDLRLHDNHSLHISLQTGFPVLPIFIFDTNILDDLTDKCDKRVDHIHRTLRTIKAELEKHGSTLRVLHGEPLDMFRKLTKEFSLGTVFTNHDHEPYAIARDKEIEEFLRSKGIGFETFKDISIFERDEILKDDGKPYSVFTPYSRKWKRAFEPAMCKPFPSEKNTGGLLKCEPAHLPTLQEIGFKKTDVVIPPIKLSDELLHNYHETRDFPAIQGTSRLSVHLRFGTASVREITSRALKTNEKFLNELIWREFYMAIMWHFPHVVTKAFRPAYDSIQWERNEEHFQAWCEGRTGYPLVDAGMRELNATGFMHNRVRMVVAGFLTKHLLLDWRWGEAYFARKLLDFELSSNNGGWQWASGSGCDAVPYFRVFNPELQQKKFDPKGEYVRYWAPEYGTDSYPEPIVEHRFARNRAIDRYKAVLKSGNSRTKSGQAMLF